LWARIVCAVRGLFSSRWKRPARAASATINAPLLSTTARSALDDDYARRTPEGASLGLEKKGAASPQTGSLPEGDLDYETIDQARLAVEPVLRRNRQLRDLVAETVVDDTNYQRPVRACSACKQGRLHYVGRVRLPDGR